LHTLSHLSLTKRLTLMFVAAATTVLLMLGFVIASSVEQHFEELDMEVLSGKMELTRQGLHGVTSQVGLTEFTHQLARSLVGHHGLEVMVLDADRAVIFATAGAIFEPEMVAAQASQVPPRPALWHLGEQTFRGIAQQIPTSASDSTGRPVSVVVAAATDIGHHQAYMQSFLQTLWVFVAGAAVLIGVLGWVAVRRGLTPLRTMREQAQVVNAQQLSHRLAVQSVPQELAELAESLNDMLARLEVAFARLSDFSSDIAHELRTPVSNLMTQTQVALSRPRNATEYREILESNAEELEHMARMISDMLLLARAEHGLVTSSGASFTLASEICALFDYYDAVAEEKGLQLVLTGDATVAADRLMLRRALANLLSNAIRHATPHTKLQVDISTYEDVVSIGLENSGDVIPPEFLERIFDRFFRVDAARQRSEGTGLGLAIAKSIVLAHGGRISASSAQARTRFTVTLPQASTQG
jgi:two-component system heavy metal sensor histidine kinase CusS